METLAKAKGRWDIDPVTGPVATAWVSERSTDKCLGKTLLRRLGGTAEG